MIQGQRCTQEVAIASNNVLNEFANFNEAFTWNKPSGGANATILNNVLGRESYFGKGCCFITFLGNGETQFNAGDSSMRRIIQKTGNYILSYAFNKSDENSDINFTIEMLVNDVPLPTHTISQNLYFSSGFTDNQWNVYFQSVYLEYGDVIDFNFYVQSDTTACTLAFDRLKLEIDDKGFGYPTFYTEADLDVIEEENILSIGSIGSNSSIEVTASLTGAVPTNSTRSYVVMKYPTELIDLGLEVGVPLVTANDEVKFIVHNHSGGSVTIPDDLVYNFKIVR